MARLPLLAAKVLIVEDDYWQASECRECLREAGAEVVAMTGAIPAALASIDAKAVNIGLLDINLGGLHSFDVARALIARRVPVLFLTGYEATVLPADLDGATIITKPAAWDDVIARLAALLCSPVGSASR